MKKLIVPQTPVKPGTQPSLQPGIPTPSNACFSLGHNLVQIHGPYSKKSKRFARVTMGEEVQDIPYKLYYAFICTRCGIGMEICINSFIEEK